jgi:hypothetical protein
MSGERQPNAAKPVIVDAETSLMKARGARLRMSPSV